MTGRSRKKTKLLIDQLIEQLKPLASSAACGAALEESEPLPDAGIYLIFDGNEPSKIWGEGVGRLVRIGTHRLRAETKQNLRKRINLHLSGKPSSSSFCADVARALETRAKALCASADPSARDYIGALKFAAIEVDSHIDRGRWEKALIAVFSSDPFKKREPASKRWLGNDAKEDIRASGLWNSDHVGSKICTGCVEGLISHLSKPPPSPFA